MENKTKSVVIDATATKKVSHTTKARVTEKIYVDANKTATNHSPIEQQLAKNANPYFSYFPDFYKREFKRAELNAIILGIFSLILLIAFSLACAFTVEDKSPSTYWLIVLYAIPLFIFFPICFKVIYRLKRFVIESKTINFKDDKPTSINIINVYKSMKVANINANWFCSLVYVISILAFMLLVIVSWGTGTFDGVTTWQSFANIFTKNPFSGESPLRPILQPVSGRLGYFITFIGLIVFFLGTIFIHIFTVTSSYVRIGRIEGYYNSFIITPAEIADLKKKTNRRDMIIFCVCSIVVGLIVYSVYKNLKNKKNK